MSLPQDKARLEEIVIKLQRVSIWAVGRHFYDRMSYDDQDATPPAMLFSPFRITMWASMHVEAIVNSVVHWPNVRTWLCVVSPQETRGGDGCDKVRAPVFALNHWHHSKQHVYIWYQVTGSIFSIGRMPFVSTGNRMCLTCFIRSCVFCLWCTES